LIYLDTSVLVAYYYPEPLSDVAQKVVRSQSHPAISSLTEVELISALARKTREGGLSKQGAERIATLFLSHVEEGLYRRLLISEQHYVQARDWLQSFQTPLRTLDALHLAVAAATDLQLVTADKTLASSANDLGLVTQFLSPPDESTTTGG
jgi:uncharacterized protein